jgi:hypothetical protein
MSKNRFISFRSQILSRKRPEGLIRIYYYFVVVIVVVVVVIVTTTTTTILNPWWRILFEKLIVTQLVKKILSLWNPKVHYRVYKSPTLDPIPSQPNPVRPIDTNLPKVHLNVILLPTLTSSQWFLNFGSPNQNPVNNSSPMRATCPAQFFILDFDYPNNR